MGELIKRIRQFYLEGNNTDLMLKIVFTPIVLTLVFSLVTMFLSMTYFTLFSNPFTNNKETITDNGVKTIVISKEEYERLQKNSELYLKQKKD